MDEQAVKAILVTAVGSALGAAFYTFIVLPWAQKFFSNNG